MAALAVNVQERRARLPEVFSLTPTATTPHSSPPRAIADRARALDALAGRQFDLLVVGGGITGAGIARDAAMRGLRVALVERDDFASGTSSRSSRLVHGGLRYLEHGYLHLVFEASAERRTLLRIAPHLVRPLPFTWPVYEGARVPRWKLGAGLTLYDVLSLYRNVAPHRRLSAAEVIAREPALRREGLEGGAIYYDAATDDARLTLANILAAIDAGAVVANHAAVRALVVRDGRAAGARVCDTLGGRELEVRARVVVNATGPWSDELRRLEEPERAPGVRGTKGVHVAVPRERVGNHEALTLLSPLDGRVMFVLPHDEQTIIGTTDTETDASPSEVRASRDDVDYLLRSANRFFPDAALEAADVIEAWAGIRPLIASGFGGSAAGASREHVIEEGERGVLTISGGKLTTYRVMAAELVDEAERALGRPVRRAATERIPLPGGDFDSLAALEQEATRATGSAEVGTHLARSYGTAWRTVWGLAEARRELALPVAGGLPYVRAELTYGVACELARTLADLLVRRTHVAFETRDAGRAAARTAADVIAPQLGWGAREIDAALAAYDRDAGRLFAIEPDGR